MAIVAHGGETHALKAGEAGEIVFDRTPFNAESGGQAVAHCPLQADLPGVMSRANV